MCSYALQLSQIVTMQSIFHYRSGLITIFVCLSVTGHPLPNETFWLEWGALRGCLSPHLTDLFNRVFVLLPDVRCTLRDLLRHPWVLERGGRQMTSEDIRDTMTARSVCLSVCLSFLYLQHYRCLSVCLSVCLSFLYLWHYRCLSVCHFSTSDITDVRLVFVRVDKLVRGSWGTNYWEEWTRQPSGNH